ncbi:MAG TPA: hypothetical protein VII45_06470 [Solirubrobacterales bacterium]
MTAAGLIGLFGLASTSAEATTAQAPAGTAVSVGAAISGESTNFKLVSENEAGEEGTTGSVECASGKLTGVVTENGGSEVAINITGEVFSECKGPMGSTVDTTTNATAASPWRLRIQQPNEKGEITAHYSPAPGSTLQSIEQIQVLGFDVATCVYSGTTMQLTGSVGSNIFHIAGTRQRTRQSGNPLFCAKYLTLSGQGALKSSGNALVVDMT